METTKGIYHFDFVELSYNNGDDFEFLRYAITDLPFLNTYKLNVITRYPGNLILRINDNWLYLENKKTFNVDITNYCCPDTTNVIDVYCTNSKFPFVQQVQTLKIESITADRYG